VNDPVKSSLMNDLCGANDQAHPSDMLREDKRCGAIC